MHATRWHRVVIGQWCRVVVVWAVAGCAVGALAAGALEVRPLESPAGAALNPAWALLTLLAGATEAVLGATGCAAGATVCAGVATELVVGVAEWAGGATEPVTGAGTCAAATVVGAPACPVATAVSVAPWPLAELPRLGLGAEPPAWVASVPGPLCEVALDVAVCGDDAGWPLPALCAGPALGAAEAPAVLCRLVLKDWPVNVCAGMCALNGVTAMGDTAAAPAPATSAGLGGVGAVEENAGPAVPKAGAEKLGAGGCAPPLSGPRKLSAGPPPVDNVGAWASAPLNPRPNP